jgi:hypothetical protein
MTDNNSPFPKRSTRFGFHYFPDTLHYRESDLQTWLPELISLGVSWLVLQSPLDRAIPEDFIRTLIKSGIEPLVTFNLPLAAPVDSNEISTLFEVYSRWGVHGVILFDKPNSRSAWSSSSWVQQDLVERFLDRYIPLANQALKAGLTPIFPPLDPGGSYWDTAFLRSSLESLQRRKQNDYLDNLVLSAYGWTNNHSLNWGMGGPESWPETHPYITPPQSQDQCGLRIYEWYQAITQAVLGKTSPVILLGCGVPGDPSKNLAQFASKTQQEAVNLSIFRLLAGDTVPDPDTHDQNLNPLPPQVICSNFWLLSADETSPYYPQAWFQKGDNRNPAAQVVINWKAQPAVNPVTGKQFSPLDDDSLHPIAQYLLLPVSDEGVSDWYLQVIQPFLKKHLPTVGFSLDEAMLAKHVIALGNQQVVPETQLDRLRQAGCLVERISGDGTTIATTLLER